MLPALLLFATSALALPTAPRPFLNDNVLVERSATLDPRQLADIPQGVQLLDYWPRITSPAKGDVFQAGGQLLLSWNNTKPDIPDNQIHKFSPVILGFLDESNPGSGYNLDVQHPLGNVSFYSGSTSASLPLPADLATRSTYLLFLGSTSNICPLFTINAVASSSSSAALTSSSTSAASSTSSAPAHIQSQGLTVHFPDGETTVVGVSSTSSASFSSETSLVDINAPASHSSSASSSASANSPTAASSSEAASSTSASSSTSSSASSSMPSSSVAANNAPSPAAAAAASATPSKTSGATLSHNSLSSLAVGAAAAFAGALVLVI
ncbi:hypothetical protein Rt10032_c06g2944 [Rhodotorula toruloides]|uniref:Uncharacterized protein n=1 Tax=Rhodotorula toruloides TaxID=5286 RepID=A0A511KEX5_RHOTO|nr:hypothetical protein Rt10032_c06g2944 [Rhodotorula toruloides]